MNRRKWIAGGLAFAGASMASRMGFAFGRQAASDFTQATKILRPYGVTVAGLTTNGHDDLHFAVAPLLANTEYSQTIAAPSGPFRTSIFDGAIDLVHTHDGGIDPCWKTRLTEDLVASQFFDSDAPGMPFFESNVQMLDGGHIGTVELAHFHDGDISPCWRSVLERDVVTSDLFDAGQITPHLSTKAEMLGGGVIGNVDLVHFHDGAIDPCWKTLLERGTVTTTFGSVVDVKADMDGRVGAITMTVNDPNADLTITIGLNTYRLVNGELVRNA
jgi:hypothetical protein